MISDDDTTDIAPRLDIPSIYQRKLKMLSDLRAMQDLDKMLGLEFEELHGYCPLVIGHDGYRSDCKDIEQQVDRVCWKYLVSLFRLEAYMLCTDYDQMMQDIEDCRTPEFSIENAEGWLAGLKGLIFDNVKTLVKKVFKEITEGTYHVGGWNGPEKKRNNNGVDSRFILRTNDFNGIWGYSTRPTVTDDLEKVCYIIAGKPLPDKTAKQIMCSKQIDTFECDFFSIKVCRNGNTHYTLSDDVRDKLNLYGPEGAIIGEDIKIKIVERSWK